MNETQNTQTYESESSIFVHPIQKPKESQSMLPTWFLIVFLFICFYILKKFIYIKDDKRHDK
jgi:hypothetical protein